VLWPSCSFCLGCHVVPALQHQRTCHYQFAAHCVQQYCAGAVQEMEATCREMAAKVIQAAWGAFRARTGALVIQKHFRGFCARRAYAKAKALAAFHQVLRPLVACLGAQRPKQVDAFTKMYIVAELVHPPRDVLELILVRLLIACRRTACTH
jgi:hypothetical protein